MPNRLTTVCLTALADYRCRPFSIAKRREIEEESEEPREVAELSLARDNCQPKVTSKHRPAEWSTALEKSYAIGATVLRRRGMPRLSKIVRVASERFSV